MAGIAGVFKDISDTFSSFLRGSNRRSMPQRDQARIQAKVAVLARNADALKRAHNISSNDMQALTHALEFAQRTLRRAEKRRGSLRIIQEEMDSFRSILSTLGTKYNIDMDWTGYLELNHSAQLPEQPGTLQRSMPAESQDDVLTDLTLPGLTEVQICIWIRPTPHPSNVSFLDQPGRRLTKSFTKRTQINRVLSSLMHEDIITLGNNTKIRCYSPREQEHSYTVPALRWRLLDENLPLASLPTLNNDTIIHIIQDVNPFLLFVFYVQPSQPARGIVITARDPERVDHVDDDIRNGLSLTGLFHYQHIEGSPRLQLYGLSLKPYGCDWCILNGRPSDTD
ncbi:hypothetical protein FRC02_010116 [Tulasnella sp. 418]|nr:hypothetical protein FRC02_010116 [Tulasnella sp. 418]